MVRWAVCFIHVLWTSACLGVRKIIRLPADSCLTGCKWTLKLRLKTTCQGSPPPEETLGTVRRVTKILHWTGVMEMSSGQAASRSFSTRNAIFRIWFRCVKVQKGIYHKLILFVFPQLLVSFDIVVHAGSWSTSLPESLEVCANWREGAWPLTSAHWLIAATVCPTVFVHEWLCTSFIYCALIYLSMYHASHRKCVLL